MTGWKLVPKTPTPEMLRAFVTAWDAKSMRGMTFGERAAHEWACILAAAPKLPDESATEPLS